jgi:hypothetical protein
MMKMLSRNALCLCTVGAIFITAASLQAQSTDFSGIDAAYKLLNERFVNGSDWTPEQAEKAAITGILESLGSGARGFDYLVERAKKTELPQDDLDRLPFYHEVLPPDVGYLFFGRLEAGLADQVREIINDWAHPDVGEPRIGALIIDLRFLDDLDLDLAASILDLFADPGTVLFGVEGENARKFTAGEAPSELAKAPVVVVLNDRTADAGEALAGGFYDVCDAVTVGRTTAGVGATYQKVAFAHGLEAEVATSKLVFANGRSSFPGGIVPDIEAKLDPELELALMLQRTGVKTKAETELSKALEEVREEEAVSDMENGNSTSRSDEELSDTELERRRVLELETEQMEQESRFGLDRDSVLQRAVDLVRGLKALRFRS